MEYGALLAIWVVLLFINYNLCRIASALESRNANNAVSGGAERRTLDGLVGSSESKGK